MEVVAAAFKVAAAAGGVARGHSSSTSSPVARTTALPRKSLGRRIGLRQSTSPWRSPERISPRIALPIRSSLSLEPQVEAPPIETSEGVNPPPDHQKTVQVRFNLNKQCKFGQRFLLSGGHHVLGLWDPSRAVPLQWSEGHVWTASLELPVEKSIAFKFILRGCSGEFKWQPGPNRTLDIQDTDGIIVVSADWDFVGSTNIVVVEVQKEEETLIVSEEQSMVMEDNGVLSERSTLEEESNLAIIEA